MESECGREEGGEFGVEAGVREAEACEGGGVEGVDLLVLLGWPGGEHGDLAVVGEEFVYLVADFWGDGEEGGSFLLLEVAWFV